MKESDARIEIAKTQNEIFKRIFNNISEEGFNTDIDLTGIPTKCIRDYWTYTIGFLVVQNFENFGINLSEEDLLKIIQGHFKLKYLTNQEYSDLKTLAKKDPKVKGVKETLKLYSIQDGTYSILTNRSSKYKNGKSHQLILDSDVPKYYADKNPDFTPATFIQVIRNLFAHSAPYVNKSNIVFLNKDDILEIPKMWLRGYSELFSQTQKTIDAEFLIKELSTHLKNSGNNLETIQDVDDALSFAKTIIFEQMPTNSFRINNFIKTRLTLIPNFNSLSVDEKIKTIAYLLANNPNYITSNAESINPMIIYNLQQLMSEELIKRDEFLDLTMADVDWDSLAALDESIKDTERRIEEFKQKHAPFRKPAEQVQYKRMCENLNQLVKQLGASISDITKKSTIESSLMHLYSAEGLKYLPVEVAVNTVCLMGFNALVTSAFYDDLIFKTNVHEFTEKQKNYFDNLSLNSISYKHNGTAYKLPYDANTKFFILKELRNSICHGLITYQIPYKKANNSINFNDVEITFYVDKEHAEVSGKLIDFYNLFSNDKIFFKKRTGSIVTGPQRELNENGEPILNDESSSSNNSQDKK